MLKAALAGDGFNFSYTTDLEGPERGEPRAVRRADDLRQPRHDHAGAGEGAARLRGERQGLPADPLRVVTASELAGVHRAGRRAVPAARHRRVHDDVHAARTIPSWKGLQPFQVWDETYVHTQAQPRTAPCSWTRDDADGQGAVDVGAHARQGPRVLHRVRPRRARVEPPDVPQAASGTRILWAVDPAREGAVDRR